MQRAPFQSSAHTRSDLHSAAIVLDDSRGAGGAARRTGMSRQATESDGPPHPHSYRRDRDPRWTTVGRGDPIAWTHDGRPLIVAIDAGHGARGGGGGGLVRLAKVVPRLALDHQKVRRPTYGIVASSPTPPEIAGVGPREIGRSGWSGHRIGEDTTTTAAGWACRTPTGNALPESEWDRMSGGRPPAWVTCLPEEEEEGIDLAQRPNRPSSNPMEAMPRFDTPRHRSCYHCGRDGDRGDAGWHGPLSAGVDARESFLASQRPEVAMVREHARHVDRHAHAARRQRADEPCRGDRVSPRRHGDCPETRHRRGWWAADSPDRGVGEWHGGDPRGVAFAVTAGDPRPRDARTAHAAAARGGTSSTTRAIRVDGRVYEWGEREDGVFHGARRTGGGSSALAVPSADVSMRKVSLNRGGDRFEGHQDTGRCDSRDRAGPACSSDRGGYGDDVDDGARRASAYGPRRDGDRRRAGAAREGRRDGAPLLRHPSTAAGSRARTRDSRRGSGLSEKAAAAAHQAQCRRRVPRYGDAGDGPSLGAAWHGGDDYDDAAADDGGSSEGPWCHHRGDAGPSSSATPAPTPSRTMESEPSGSGDPLAALGENMDLLDRCRHVVFSGGSVRVIALCAAYCAVSAACRTRLGRPLHARLRGAGGTSAGSLLALILVCGVGEDETRMRDLVCDERLWDLGALWNEVSLARFVRERGFCAPDALRRRVEALFDRLGLPHDIDFYGLRRRTGRDLVCNAACITDGSMLVMSPDSTPHMQVRRALCKSMCVPFLMPPCERDDLWYVDGGLFDNYIVHAFPEESTIGFCLQEGTDEPDAPDDDDDNDDDDGETACAATASQHCGQRRRRRRRPTPATNINATRTTLMAAAMTAMTARASLLGPGASGTAGTAGAAAWSTAASGGSVGSLLGGLLGSLFALRGMAPGQAAPQAAAATVAPPDAGGRGESAAGAPPGTANGVSWIWHVVLAVCNRLHAVNMAALTVHQRRATVSVYTPGFGDIKLSLDAGDADRLWRQGWLSGLWYTDRRALSAWTTIESFLRSPRHALHAARRYPHDKSDDHALPRTTAFASADVLFQRRPPSDRDRARGDGKRVRVVDDDDDNDDVMITHRAGHPTERDDVCVERTNSERVAPEVPAENDEPDECDGDKDHAYGTKKPEHDGHVISFWCRDDRHDRDDDNEEEEAGEEKEEAPTAVTTITATAPECATAEQSRIAYTAPPLEASTRTQSPEVPPVADAQDNEERLANGAIGLGLADRLFPSETGAAGNAGEITSPMVQEPQSRGMWTSPTAVPTTDASHGVTDKSEDAGCGPDLRAPSPVTHAQVSLPPLSSRAACIDPTENGDCTGRNADPGASERPPQSRPSPTPTGVSL